MKLNFTGFGSAFNKTGGSCSAYFIYENNIYIIDSGETTYKSMCKVIDFNRFEKVVYIITHLHNDHVGSLGTTISDLYLNLGIKIDLLHPEKTIIDLLDLMGVDQKMYNVIHDKKILYNELSIEFIKTNHVVEMECYGVKILQDNNSFYYSGDSNSIPECILNELENNKIHTVYQDTTINPESSGSHYYYKNILNDLTDKLKEKIYCMHLDENSSELLRSHGLKTVGGS